MSNKKLTYGEIWKTLRAIDTTKIQYQKSGLDYIGWADAWACLMDHYPESTYEFPSPTFYFDGQENKTCKVNCKVTIGDLSREFSLPVMTSMMPMKSIVNPTSRDIADAEARCLVKVLAIFGLGLHLWEKGDKKPQKKSNPEVQDFGGF